MTRISDWSVGRRWRCLRSDRISFDFVVVGKGRSKDWVRCQTVPIEGQAAIYGAERVRDFADGEQDFTKRHIKKCAVLVPLSLDDLAQSINATS